MKKTIALIAAILMITMGIPLVTATTPEFDDTHDSEGTVWNTAPYIVSGWIVILNQSGIEVWNQTDPSGSSRSDSYIWESEKLVVYAIIHDDNGPSDLLAHTAEAWLSPGDEFVTDLGIDHYTNTAQTEALFKGEKIIPDPGTWQCMHDVYVTDTDGYGATATNSPYTIYDTLYINPMMTSTFLPGMVYWSNLHSGDAHVAADDNTFVENVSAYCENGGSPVYLDVNYVLRIHGTDMVGGVGTSHVIPCGNIEYSMDSGPEAQLTNGEVALGEFITGTQINFDFFVTVPWLEPGDYSGEIDFSIQAI